MSAMTMRGHLRHCWLFTWRVPVAKAAPHLPKPLELVTRDGFAFLNVVVCEVAGLRPAPLPAAIGLTYWHVAYRLHAKARLADGETVEGLYFLRSDCDRRLVALPGNLLTDFHFHLAAIDVRQANGIVAGQVWAEGATARFRICEETPPRLTEGSPFASVEEASEFLKYKPFALVPTGERHVRIVRVIRREEDWRHRIVHVERSEWEFPGGWDAAPEVCYAVAPIDYEWCRAETREVAP